MRGIVDAICFGESMVVVAPDPPQPLCEGPPTRLGCAGAESNVAIYLAGMGLHVAWRGRLGTDPFADLITGTLNAAKVDTDLVETDPNAPTGVYFKDPQPTGTQVHYYRSNSAASHMGPGFMDCMPSCRLWHFTGITAALSNSARALATEIPKVSGASLTSFDVNYRPALWSPQAAQAVLRDIANRVDIAFVGLDEAHALWGTETPQQVRETLPGAGTLVVKDAANGATAFGPMGPIWAAAPTIDIVEPVGAGDAFAAGYLYGLLTDAGTKASLELGHLFARSALSVAGDIGPLPDPHDIAALAKPQ
ncbi:sugar kinase [Natronoglycomyces albus]|uniref:Sugar kinase n=1 Tax=Natronoglycomyces albus TaxID=2811108 RepID=A0A895XNI6_9ACTN|nr:sugar kinase [Natronoglycomyces albus]QSB04056.1 sugar kinase [Natronoglycomyces albus]